MEQNNMTNQELIDYLKDVFELEKQLYTYEKIEEQYNEKLKWVAVPSILHIEYYSNSQKVKYCGDKVYEHFIPVISNSSLDPTPKPEWKQTKEFREIIKDKKRGKFKVFMKLLGVAFVFVLAILFLAFFIFGTNALPSLCVVGVIAFLISIPSIKGDLDYSNVETISQNLKAYYHRCMDNESLLIAQSEIPLKNHMENERSEFVIKPKEEAKRLLDNLYSQDIIFPKYRNFAAVAQIYEYLISGRCDKLEGADGAYNLYERELRLNIIIDKLDIIIGQLENLNRTMSTMCSAIQLTNCLLANISMSLGKIETNTALTAYNSQCIAYNTNMSNRYNY